MEERTLTGRDDEIARLDTENAGIKPQFHTTRQFAFATHFPRPACGRRAERRTTLFAATPAHFLKKSAVRALAGARRCAISLSRDDFPRLPGFEAPSPELPRGVTVAQEILVLLV